MLPHRPNAITQREQRLEPDTVASKEKVIFVCIVEIKQVAGLMISRERPTLALCDVASTTSWVSSQYLNELETASSTGLNLADRTTPRKGGEPPRIHIRWSCDTLGQKHEEGVFCVEPKAQFKILFGCAYNITHPPTKRYQSSHYTRRTGKRIESETQISEKAVETFRRGIKEGKLIPIERMPELPVDRAPYMTIADLETNLDYMYDSYSSTEQALSTVAPEEDYSTYLPPSYGNTFSSMDLVSIKDSDIGHGRSRDAESPNTSFSRVCRQSPSWTTKQKRHRDYTQPTHNIEGWVSQSLCEEPQPWLESQIVRSGRRPFSFKRCRDPTPKQQAKLSAVQAAAQEEAAEYWQWDNEAQRYKHYDEGSSEPVWYSPP